jgi:hypothetical protein
MRLRFWNPPSFQDRTSREGQFLNHQSSKACDSRRGRTACPTWFFIVFIEQAAPSWELESSWGGWEDKNTKNRRATKSFSQRMPDAPIIVRAA